MSILEAILFGFLEGMTEFLPISSTGHLILLSKYLSIEQDDFHKSFEVIIQFGAILAVVVYFARDIFRISTLTTLFFAFLPTGIIGFFAYSTIKSLFDFSVVAYMLIVGGIVLILLDVFLKSEGEQTDKIEDVSIKQAIYIGFFQALSMIPGTSRSGATIVGGIVNKLDKVTAAKFSFLLAVPTMFVASSYDIYKNYEAFLVFEGLQEIGIAFVVSFLTAMAAIRFFLTLIKRVGFYPFGIYRIVLGSVFLYFY